MTTNTFTTSLLTDTPSRLADFSLPHKKQEDWRYLNLRSLSEASLQAATAASDDSLAALSQIDNLAAQRITFVNGQYDASLSLLNAEQGVAVVRFDDANSEQQALIKQHFNVQANEKAGYFNQLNLQNLSDAVLVHIAKDVQCKQPILVNYLSCASAGSLAQQRVLVVVDQGAQATVIEHFNSVADEHQALLNGVSEFIIADNARLMHYRLLLEHASTQHISSVYVALQRDAQYKAFVLGLGSVLKRNEMVVNHNVGGSHCEIKGVYLPQGKQQIDFHTNIEHKVAHCTTSEVFRGIMADESNAVFNGRIHIHPQAQKTLAELSNKNLLLSNKAQINTKPELEIYADDVRCAHGATVAQIDDKSLFYMQSRGISRVEAEVMLSFGFINELLNELDHEAITHLLRPMLARLFAKDESLLAHLES